MTDASQYLLELARRAAQPYAKLSTIRVATVTGSAAKDLSDFNSDIDMTMYYEGSLPDEVVLHDIRRQLNGSECKWVIGDREAGYFAEAYHIEGVEVQIGHTTIEAWEETMAQVLKSFGWTAYKLKNAPRKSTIWPHDLQMLVIARMLEPGFSGRVCNLVTIFLYPLGRGVIGA